MPFNTIVIWFIFILKRIISEDKLCRNIIIADSLDRSTYEWMEYKDLDRVKKDIDSQVSKLIKALESENVNKIIKYFCEAERDNYKEIFENDTELMKSLSSFFGDMELVYLSEKTDDKETYMPDWRESSSPQE